MMKVAILKGKSRLERRLILVAAACCLLFLSCGAAERNKNVVRITEVNKSGEDLYKGLKSDDVAKLEELKKTLTTQEKGDPVKEILGTTPSYTVSQYLQKYPDSKNIGEDYKIGGYDVLAITVYGEKDLTLESIRVSADGSISFPLIGRIAVADLNTSEVEQLIARKLAEGDFLLDAHVSVMVAKYEGRKYSVLGSVTNPGNYPLQAQEKILDGLSKAGGLAGGSEKGENQLAMIIRTLNPGLPNQTKIVINMDLNALFKGRDQISNIYLADKDVVYIPKADYFYIIGEVKNPGSYAFNKKDITIVEAISMAGGFTRIAARNKTRIVRVENGAEKIYDINVDAITSAGKMIQAVPIKPNDLIVVPESFF